LQVEPLRRTTSFFRSTPSIGPSTANVHTSSPSGKYTSIRQALRLIYAEEGAAAMWKGHVPAQGLSLVFGVVQFVSFEQFERLAHVHAPEMSSTHSSTVSFFAGMASGFLAGTAALPLDVLRTRLVAQGKRKVRAELTLAHTCLGVRQHMAGGA
jgi:solute carrier family 25 thiamine pyrophosphate transporter 19